MRAIYIAWKNFGALCSFCSLFAALIFCGEALAAVVELPPLRWGMDEAGCCEVMALFGADRVAAPQPETSGDRRLRSNAIVRGLTELYFERRASGWTERTTLTLFRGELFRAVTEYGGYARGAAMRDAVTDAVTASLGTSPMARRDGRSGMETYIWRKGGDDLIFSFRELPGIDIYHAVLDHRDRATLGALKRAGMI